MLSALLDAQVRQLHLWAKRAVEDWLGGAYHSVFKGVGVAFEEVREYQPGDDVRAIDWNVTARSGAPFIKRFVEERELTVMLAVDIGATMAFGSGTATKRQIAAETVALVALAALHNNDRVGLIVVDGQRRHLVPPRKGSRHALRLLRDLLHLADPANVGSGRPDLADALRTLQRTLHRRAMVFVASDFLSDDYLKPLQYAAARHDLIALAVHDPWERELPDVGWLSIRGPEGDVQQLDTANPAIRAAYAERMKVRADEIRHTVRRSKADWVELSAAGGHLEALRRFFKSRERRLRR